HEIINVSLTDRPGWLFDLNPLGKVPCIEFGADNKVLYESLIVCQYLDEAYPDVRPLQPRDPYQRATDRQIIAALCVDISALRHKYLPFDDLAAVWPEIAHRFKKVDTLLANKRADNRYLSGEALPGLLDYAVWPFIERIPTMVDLAGHNSAHYLVKELPTVHDYSQQMLADPTVQK
ncbi:unnamed protein product, partial [Medioppia subpectinata]